MPQGEALKLRTNPFLFAGIALSFSWFEFLTVRGIYRTLEKGLMHNIGDVVIYFVILLFVGFVLYRVIKNTGGYVLIIENGILRYKDASFGRWEEINLRNVVVTKAWDQWDFAHKTPYRQKKLILETKDGKKLFINLSWLWNRKALFKEIDSYALLGSFDYTREQAIK
jgi:hypothetical protein